MENAQEEMFDPEILNSFDWDFLVKKISTFFGYDRESKEDLRNHKVKKVLAALPAIAGCRNPTATAMNLLGIYILGESEKAESLSIQGYKEKNDLFSRLEWICQIDGGDPVILSRGIQFISLSILEKQCREDQEFCCEKSPYPWNLESIIHSLKQEQQNGYFWLNHLFHKIMES